MNDLKRILPKPAHHGHTEGSKKSKKETEHPEVVIMQPYDPEKDGARHRGGREAYDEDDDDDPRGGGGGGVQCSQQ